MASHWRHWALKVLYSLTFNFVNNSLRYFLKLLRDFLKIVYCCWNIFISSKRTFQSAWKIIIFILSANCYLNKTRQSRKNIYQITDLIEFINASLLFFCKFFIYNRPEYFTVFRSILLRIVYCVFDKFLESVTLLFCLLIVHGGLIILFISDAG